MTTKYLICSLLLFLVSCTTEKSESELPIEELDWTKDYEVLRVNTESGLNMRKGPGTDNEVVKALTYSTRVMIKTNEMIPEVINGVSGNWVQAKDFHSNLGWLFDAYLVNTAELFRKRNSLYGEYRNFEGWQSGFAISLELEEDYSYRYFDVDHGEYRADFYGTFSFSNDFVLLHQPTLVKKSYFTNYPVKFEMIVSTNNLILKLNRLEMTKKPF